MKKIIALLTLFALVANLAAGCGGGTQNGAPPTPEPTATPAATPSPAPTPTPTPEPTPTPIPINWEEAEAVFKINLGGPDLDDGWVSDEGFWEDFSNWAPAASYENGAMTRDDGSAIRKFEIDESALEPLTRPAPFDVYMTLRDCVDIDYTFDGLTPGGLYYVYLHLNGRYMYGPSQVCLGVEVNGEPVPGFDRLDVFRMGFDLYGAANGLLATGFEALADGGGALVIKLLKAGDWGSGVCGIEIIPLH
ncbi:MAG: hypothetical protein FWF03_04770 [Defluviitaleaceae bacterium]|nr:hypothetical protein [Defluviitaleaceae bacterium]